jgi:signal transduction histidine kinase
LTGSATERLADALALAAHDLAEPLREAGGFAELLERRAADRLTPEDEELLAHVLAGTRRLDAMVAGLAAYVRVERIELKREAVELDDLPPVLGDPGLLADMLARLVDNARKFGAGDVEVSGRREGETVVVEVADDGPGLSDGDRERVLRLFQRAHPRDEYAGAGVGLTIAATIAARHGGSLALERREGGGTVARVVLPAA